MATSLPVIDGWTEYDWAEMLGQGGYAWYAAQQGDSLVVTEGAIERVIWMYTDAEPRNWDNSNYACLVLLHSGEYAMCEAWHDLTGWDCQAGVTWKVAATLDGAVQELSQWFRDRFNDEAAL